MKVLHVFKVYLPESYGGIEQSIYQLSCATSQLGVENTILCITHGKDDSTLHRDEATVVRCPVLFEKASTPVALKLFTAYPRLARECDIIHYHFPYPIQDILHVCFRTGKPSLVTYHSDIVRQKVLNVFYRPLMRAFLSTVDAIVATSENYLRTSNTLMSYRDKVTVIPIGINRALFPPLSQEKVDYWKNRLGQRFFLFVGVFRYYKGLSILLHAARNRDYKIVIAGVGPLEQQLKTEAKDLGLTNVEFVGRVSDEDKVALLSLCLAVVFPSHLRSEAFGVTLVEGAMFGKPLISAEIGTGTTFINIHDVTGIVVPPSDPDALRGAMDRLHSDTALAERYGANALARFEQYFSAERMGAMYLQLYNTILRERSGAR